MNTQHTNGPNHQSPVTSTNAEMGITEKGEALFVQVKKSRKIGKAKP